MSRNSEASQLSVVDSHTIRGPVLLASYLRLASRDIRDTWSEETKDRAEAIDGAFGTPEWYCVHGIMVLDTRGGAWFVMIKVSIDLLNVQAVLPSYVGRGGYATAFPLRGRKKNCDDRSTSANNRVVGRCHTRFHQVRARFVDQATRTMSSYASKTMI
jgi:hypothetical protein